MKKNPVGWCTFLEQLFWELTNHPTRLIFSLHFLEKENRHLVYSKLQILYNKILMTSPTSILLPLRNGLSSQQADCINGTCYLFFVNVMQHFKSLLLTLVDIFKHLNVKTLPILWRQWIHVFHLIDYHKCFLLVFIVIY